mgnify:CR=1 FL=1
MARPKADEPRVIVTLKVPISIYDAITLRAVAKGLTWHAFVVGCLRKSFGIPKTLPPS